MDGHVLSDCLDAELGVICDINSGAFWTPCKEQLAHGCYATARSQRDSNPLTSYDLEHANHRLSRHHVLCTFYCFRDLCCFPKYI